MKNKILLGIMVGFISTSSFAYTNINKLTADSSWEEIRSNPHVDFRNDGVKVGNLNTSVFFVEQKNGMLFTKKPTRDGYYKQVNSNSNNDRSVYVQTGESIKSGPITIPVAQFKIKRINSDRDEYIKTGYKDYTQPVTRKIQVYTVNYGGRDNDNRRERLLFEKEYTIPNKM